MSGSRLHEWHSAAALRDLLVGGRNADALQLAEQIEFVRANWRAIVRAFDPIRTADTHMRLAFLRWEQLKRRSKAASQTADSGARNDAPEEKEGRQHD